MGVCLTYCRTLSIERVHRFGADSGVCVTGSSTCEVSRAACLVAGQKFRTGTAVAPGRLRDRHLTKRLLWPKDCQLVCFYSLGRAHWAYAQLRMLHDNTEQSAAYYPMRIRQRMPIMGMAHGMDERVPRSRHNSSWPHLLATIRFPILETAVRASTRIWPCNAAATQTDQTVH